MTIYRNGFEITLTQGELYKAYREQLRSNYEEECRYQLEQRGYEDVSDDDIEPLLDAYEEHLSYHTEIDEAVVDAWDYILDDDYPYINDIGYPEKGETK